MGITKKLYQIKGGNMDINLDEITFKQLLEASGFKMVFAEDRKNRSETINLMWDIKSIAIACIEYGKGEYGIIIDPSKQQKKLDGVT